MPEMQRPYFSDGRYTIAAQLAKYMKKTVAQCLFLAVLCSLVAHAQQLTIQTEDGKQNVLQRADDIEALPHTNIMSGAPGAQITYEAVPLLSVLEKGGLNLGETLRGKRMASCLLVEAADGYKVVIALPELDPEFTNKQVALAYLRDGKPLDEKEGPYRIVIPDEKRMARWVRQVTTLKIVAVQ
jgi:hypothetical protein